MTDQSQREKIMQRILNLRAKAEDDASSENEMNGAFLRAMKLMEGYGIEEAELAIAETQGKIVLDITTKQSDVSAIKGTSHKHKIVNVLSSIARFTDTKVLFYTKSGRIVYTGHRPDLELANYLTAVIRHALDELFEEYCRNTPARGYGAKASFQLSMSNRINCRLMEMKAEQIQTQKKEKERALRMIESAEIASSTALVIAEASERKKIEVENFHRAANPTIRTVHLGGRITNRTAYGAGSNAGDRVNLNSAVSQGSFTKIGA